MTEGAADAGSKPTSGTAHRAPDGWPHGRSPSADGGRSPPRTAYRAAGEPPPLLGPEPPPREEQPWVACSRCWQGSSLALRSSSTGSRGRRRCRLRRVPAAAPRHHLPAVRDPDLCAPVHARDRPDRMGMVLGRRGRTVRHPALGRQREPAQPVSRSTLDGLGRVRTQAGRASCDADEIRGRRRAVSTRPKTMAPCLVSVAATGSSGTGDAAVGLAADA